MSTTLLERDVSPPPAKARSRFGLKRAAIAVAALAGLAAGAWFAADWWRNGRFIESTDDAYVGGNVTATRRRTSPATSPPCWSTINQRVRGRRRC